MSRGAATYQLPIQMPASSTLPEKDFIDTNNVRFFNNIKNNDYDCVIMSRPFGKIPQCELQQPHPASGL